MIKDIFYGIQLCSTEIVKLNKNVFTKSTFTEIKQQEISYITQNGFFYI